MLGALTTDSRRIMAVLGVGSHHRPLANERRRPARLRGRHSHMPPPTGLGRQGEEGGLLQTHKHSFVSHAYTHTGTHAHTQGLNSLLHPNGQKTLRARGSSRARPRAAGQQQATPQYPPAPTWPHQTHRRYGSPALPASAPWSGSRAARRCSCPGKDGEWGG